ncbi:MAG: MFS transporter [Patescibacteria group bacterium]|jgi:MFS family permease
MQRIMGMYGAWPLVGTAIASLVAGILASNQSLDEYYQLFLLTAGAQVIALVILSTVKESPQRISRRQLPGLERAVRNFTEGFRLLRNNGALRRLVLLSAFTMPFSVLLYRLAPPYFQSLNTPSSWLGTAVAVATLAALAAKLVAHKLDQRFGVMRTTLVVTMLPALAWIGLAFTATPGLAILVFILNDAAGNRRDPVFADYMNRHIPSENRATTLSIIALFVSVYAAVMRPLLATVGDYDLRTAFIVTGTILFVGALIFRVTETNTHPTTTGRVVD